MPITKQIARPPYLMRVARGEILGAKPIRLQAIFAGTLTPQDAIPSGGTYPWPTVAAPVTVSSTDATDAAAGTGMQQVLVQGLNDQFEEISELVEMNGQTGVATVQSYFRVQRVVGTRAGAALQNAGTMYAGTGLITAGVPAVNLAEMPPLSGVSQGLYYTVPKGCMLILTQAQARGDQVGQFDFYSRRAGPGMPWILGGTAAFWLMAFQAELTAPTPLPAGSDLIVRGNTIAGAAPLYGTFEGFVVDDLLDPDPT